MMMAVVIALYWIAVIGLTIYGVNCYVLMAMFFCRYKAQLNRLRDVRENFAATVSQSEWPTVTVQLPLYNERHVVARLIHAAAQLDYPTEKLDIQVLDDSTDDTAEICAELVAHYQSLGVRIAHCRRANREGYKAGALRDGLLTSSAELVAIFDADFVPRPDFLRQTIPFFFADPKVGLVQTRWGHVNDKHSLLTRAQAVAIDGHFGVEQGGRCWGGVFLNFNGTGGIWRRSAIDSAGGWHPDTLTEDLDLSYRAQLAGWKVEFLPDVEVPAEIPADMAAFKSQQRRWAKGSMQTAFKLLPMVLRAKQSWLVKLQAAVHLTHYLIHPCMLLMALLALPLVHYWDIARLGPELFVLMAIAITLSTLGPSLMYLAAQIALRRDWLRRYSALPVLLIVGMGIAVSNTRAVIEAVLGIKSSFVRTPKAGLTSTPNGHSPRPTPSGRPTYRLPFDYLFLLEAAMCAYCFWSLLVYIDAGKALIAPYLVLYTLGFGTMALASTADLVRRLISSSRPSVAPAENASLAPPESPSLALSTLAVASYADALSAWTPATGPMLALSEPRDRHPQNQ